MATIEEALTVAVRHHQEGRLDVAGGIYRQILQVAPQQPDALHLLGLVMRRQQPAMAMQLIQKAIEHNPALTEAHLNLGNLLHDLGRFDEAVRSYSHAVALRPDLDGPLQGLGASLRAAGRHEASVVTLRRGIAIRPDYVEHHNGLANALHDQQKLTSAVAGYARALAVDPTHGAACNNMSIALRGLGRAAEAEIWQKRTVRLDPGFAVAHTSLGLTLQELGRLDEAAACHSRALATEPACTAALNNMGSVLLNQNRLSEAIAHYRRAIQVDPGTPDSHRNLGIGLLVAGQFAEGWREYEWRLRCKDAPTHADLLRPRWMGEPLNGRRILLHGEQGLGDTLQFCRYVPLVAARGGHVLLGVQPSLTHLMGRLAGLGESVSSSVPLDRFDTHIPLLSLPMVFGTDFASIPASVPYLYPEPELAATWAERLGRYPGLRIGIVWAGSPGHGNDRNRSLRLDAFAPLAALPGVTLVSIQKGPTETLAATPPAGMPLVNLSPEIKDFTDTAAIAANLDLVICVDTSVAHLCGALGRPTWVLLPFAPDWRWLLDREDTPWYPTMRLFRQRRPGDWGDVLRRVEETLRARLGL